MKRTPPLESDEPAEPPSRLAGPAIGLLVTGILGLAGNVMCGMASAAISTQNKRDDPPPAWVKDVESYERGRDAAPFMQLCGCVCMAVIVYPVVIVGATQMQRGRAYALSILSAVLAMLPCGPAFLIGLPLGIWALVVLMDPEVRASFR